MATVTQLLDRGCRITGLRTTGSERALALAALQDAYVQAVSDSECSISSTDYTFTASSDDYSLSTMLSEQPTRLYHVTLTTNAGQTPLRQVSLQELLELRENQVANGTPFAYATIGFERIALYPNPAAGDVVKVHYIDPVPTLIEASAGAGEETTPSKIPVAFHWNVLLNGMVVQMLDKDQRLAESQLWEERYQKGIAKLQEYIGQMGGEANRAYVEKAMKRYRYNDQRSRW